MRIIWSMKRSKRVGTGRSGDEEDKLGGMSRSSLCLIKKIDIINVAKPWNLRRESWLAFALIYCKKFAYQIAYIA